VRCDYRIGRPLILGLVQRILILGRGGAGKSTAARRMAELTGLPLIELDTLFWHADLSPTPADKWRAIQGQLVADKQWIMDGDLGPYDQLDVRLAAADTVVVLDFPLLLCAWRALRRSPERIGFWLWLIRWRRHSRPALLQAISRFAPSARLLVLRTPRALDRFLAGLIP
jgi:adenylate kinase family enzyme